VEVLEFDYAPATGYMCGRLTAAGHCTALWIVEWRFVDWSVWRTLKTPLSTLVGTRTFQVSCIIG
jgi:hypothetical protein